MKLRLKERDMPPVQLRLLLPGALNEMLNRYVAYVGEASGREVEPKEIVVEILQQFVESDRDFRKSQRRSLAPIQERSLKKVQQPRQVNGHAQG
jgi:hypothetical protein